MLQAVFDRHRPATAAQICQKRCDDFPMWIAQVEGIGGGRLVEPVQLSGEPVTAGAIRQGLDVARDIDGPIPEVAYVDVGGNRGEAIPGLTALETYADQAVEEYLGSGSLRQIGPAVRWSPRCHASTLAWHDRSVCIVPVRPGDRDIRFDYIEEPEERDTEILLTGQRRFFTQRYVDWRLYAGRNSVVVDGESYLRPRGRGRWAARIRVLPAFPGVLVAKVNRRLGPLRSVYDEDDSQQSRLHNWEQDYPGIATKYPKLSSQALHEEAGVVFIHGTRSCCISSLVDLDGSIGLPLRRYEHDTYRALSKNADELTQLIRSTVKVNRLFLFGHSRGGLVARLAASDLLKEGWAGDIEVWTFGTPHNGTPLVGQGLELLGRQLKPLSKLRKVTRLGLGSKIDVATDEYGLPHEDSVGAMLSILTRSAALPKGVSIMTPESSERDLLNRISNCDTRYAFGGSCTVEDVHGFAIFHARFAHEMFEGQPNDLVVGLDSSMASGGAYGLTDPCTHSGYFRDPVVRGLISRA